jgi:hypothetical protein
MMRFLAFVALASLVLIAGGGCILETKTLDIVLDDDGCVQFSENQTSETFTTPDTFYLADELDQLLEDNDLARSDVKAARLISASYEVTSFDIADPNWLLTGAITVERQDVSDGPEHIIDYTSQSVLDAYNVRTVATLNEDGVDLLHRATDDYLDGQYPVLIFKVQNGSVAPVPTTEVPLVFDWEACFGVYVIIEQEYEVPDPFPGSD